MEIAINKCVDSYVTKNKLIMKILFIIIFVSLFNIVTHAKSPSIFNRENTHSVLYYHKTISTRNNRSIRQQVYRKKI